MLTVPAAPSSWTDTRCALNSAAIVNGSDPTVSSHTRVFPAGHRSSLHRRNVVAGSSATGAATPSVASSRTTVPGAYVAAHDPLRRSVVWPAAAPEHGSGAAGEWGPGVKDTVPWPI